MRFGGRIRFAIFILIFLLGYFTGSNFFDNISIDMISHTRGCFEFGLIAIIEGDGPYAVFIKMIKDAVKHFLLMAPAAFFRLMYPLMVVDHYCVGFKVGVATSVIFGLFGLKGIGECFFIVLYSIVVCAFFVCFTCGISARISIRGRNSRFNGSDIAFLKSNGMIFGLFITLLGIVFSLSKVFGLRIIGLSGSFL